MKKWLLLTALLTCSVWANEQVEKVSEGKVEPQSKPDTVVAPEQQKQFELLGHQIEPGSFRTLSWSSEQSFTGIDVGTPVLVARGENAGPVLCLTAAVHGDELNGIEITRQVLHHIDTRELNGTVIGVPIVNLDGFHNSSRYLKDRRDLNRYFPGSPDGSSADRIAHSFFNKVVSKCDALIDLHTGSFYRTNLPQIRADLSHSGMAKFSRGFGNITIIQSRASKGTLRGAALEAGILAVTMELGAPMSLDTASVAVGVDAIKHLMAKMKMLPETMELIEPLPFYVESSWLRADHSGIFVSDVALGEKLIPQQVIGTVTDPVTNASFRVRAEHHSTVIGKALNQFVYPGFALFHVATTTTPEQVELEQTKKKKEQQAKVIEKVTAELKASGVEVDQEHTQTVIEKTSKIIEKSATQEEQTDPEELVEE
ncbi:succinylglutamate desuccinylase/aspartoacylase family protein [Motilimonas pumila]|uniref:Succinylglutamate desuccinylase/Aspartoacylase catalytic domain-containing protein n=1 Tax=Motilimonas pumila TaxID=2303987 RepID=A0A418YJ47_9GAMM|nr:succinylglutamate desuccinylase/aspartoacylase family protein [Motilimonas pumila]RJG50673.1 hypothetical protein D1Z90_04150 [Motilimonas pumila]